MSNKEIPQEDVTIEEVQPEAINDMVEGFSLTGEVLRTFENKKVKIKAWSKVDMSDFRDPEKSVKKTVLSVELFNGATMDYIPNKTSLKTLMAKYGVLMSKWVGEEIELEVVRTKVSGEDRDVIYVKEL